MFETMRKQNKESIQRINLMLDEIEKMIKTAKERNEKLDKLLKK